MDKNLKFTTAILDAFEDGIYVTNQDHIVEYMNSAMIADFGDGIGKNCHQLLNQSDQKCPWCLSDDVFEGKTVEFRGFDNCSSQRDWLRLLEWREIFKEGPKWRIGMAAEEKIVSHAEKHVDVSVPCETSEQVGETSLYL